jgi:DNA-binding CsgD family transcriptional regulator
MIRGGKMLDEFLSPKLTDAERFVAKHFIRLGFHRIKIARIMNANPSTIKNQMHSVHKKMNVKSLSELQAQYILFLEERI